jgi:poly(A) polymerase
VIKKLIQKVFGGRRKSGSVSDPKEGAKSTAKVPRAASHKGGSHSARTYKRAEHGIDRRDISDAALRTCEGLQKAGYTAFVVGGAVRDLLLGRHPKDFDVATSATPEQVRNVFRRSRIIGRRFRIVHVMFGAETVEVSTFRAAAGEADKPDAEDDEVDSAAPQSASSSTATRTEDAETSLDRGHRRRRDRDRRYEAEAGKQQSKADEHGRLLRDNIFGSQEEDAIRRDFTMNALFYDPASEEVWDYVKGVPDVQAKRVVMIGEPTARYREDPVRMLRAARLAGKLGFTIDAATEKPIAELATLLANVPTARMYDEMLKVLFSGHSLACIEKLRALKLHHQVLPVIDKLLADEESGAFVRLALQRTDERINADKGVSPPFLFAALFWFPMRARQEKLEADGVRSLQAWHEAMDDVLERQRKTLAIPRRLDPLIKELWIAQPRFLQRSKVKAYRLLESPRFRANYDFFALRAEVDDAEKDIAEWWEKFQFADDDTRETMLLPDDEPKKKRRRRRRKVGGGGGDGGGEAVSDGASNVAEGKSGGDL